MSGLTRKQSAELIEAIRAAVSDPMVPATLQRQAVIRALSDFGLGPLQPSELTAYRMRLNYLPWGDR